MTDYSKEVCDCVSFKELRMHDDILKEANMDTAVFLSRTYYM